MFELTCERKFAVWRSLEGPQGEPFQPSVHEMESMSTEPDTGGLLLRPKNVQLVPVIFEKDEEPPEPSRGGVSCSLEKLMTGIRSLFRGEVLRVYREQGREARASISLGGTHTCTVRLEQKSVDSFVGAAHLPTVFVYRLEKQETFPGLLLRYSQSVVCVLAIGDGSGGVLL